MFSFRRFARRALKPAAMVAVSGILALSLTVSTTQKAEAVPGLAVLPVVIAAETAAGAAIPLAMPSVLATSLALHPVGWAIAGTAALAIGLYATKDYWLPYVTGAWGAATGGDNDSPGSAASGAKLYPGWKITGGTIVGQVFNFTSYYSGTDSLPNGKNVSVSIRLYCKNTSTAAIVIREVGYGTAIGTNATGSYQRSRPGTGQCLTGETVDGAVIGAPKADPRLGQSQTGAFGYDGPENVMQFGSQSAPSTPGFDPEGADVKYKTTVECIGDDGTKSTLTAESVGDEGGVKFPSCEAAGKGHGTGVAKVEGYAPTAPGVPGTVPETIWETSAPAVDPDYSQCGPERPGSGCKMAITIDGKPCVVGQWECENWSELYNDPTTAPRVGCTFGPYTVAVSECAVMEPAYRPGGAPATEENTDGNPSTRNNTEPGGQPYQKPTSPGTGVGVAPGAGGSTQPGADAQTVGCFPTGFAAFNPVEWVLQPIRCAFTPKPDTHTQFTNRLQTKINSVGFAPISTAWLGAYQDVGGGSGCSGPTVNFSMNGVSQSLQPFQACTEPMATVAAIANGVSTVAIVLFGGLAMVRAIGSAFGMNFSMGGKSDGD